MIWFAGRRLMVAVPTLVAISLVIFTILDLAPGDPTSSLPLTIPSDVREQIRESMGFNDPFFVRWILWVKQMFINEPLSIIEQVFNIQVGSGDRTRVLSWQSRGPVVDTIIERLPQTTWVMGLAFIFGILIAVPVGVISAYRQYSVFDQVGTFVSMVGYSVPTFFTGLLAIIIFSVKLGWFPSYYDTTLEVTDWNSFVAQIRQIVLPVGVLSMFNAAALSRFTRSAMLDNLSADYVRTARSKGLREKRVLVRHVLRNSLIPVVTLIALQVPFVFAGALITEQIFRINGIGQLMISSIHGGDVPMVQTLSFLIAAITVFFNLVADIVYGMLDPRIRYE